MSRPPEDVVLRLTHDELLARYLRKNARLERAQPSSVLDFLGEVRALAMGLAKGRYMTVEAPRAVPEFARPSLGAALLECPVFIWTEEMRALSQSYEVPDHAVSGIAFPYDAMWWTFTGSIALDEASLDGLLICKSSWLAARTPLRTRADSWIAIGIGESHEHDRPLVWIRATAPYGTNVADHAEFKAYAAMAALMTSKFVTVDKQRAVDANRKWQGRRIGDPASVNVITLRASVREAVSVERGDGPVWKQRWLVRGHMRAQWYPASRAHRLIWIAPYVKGPEGSPLKMPTYSVSR